MNIVPICRCNTDAISPLHGRAACSPLPRLHVPAVAAAGRGQVRS
jgi:hypothetical protein